MNAEIAPDFINEGADAFRQALLAFGLRTLPENSTEFIDNVESMIVKAPNPLQLPTRHIMTPGLYVRTIEMPAGSILTSEIHKTDHPFVIHAGSISVWTAEDGAVTLHAPYLGVTHPGTRRILYAHTDTVWSTFHPTDKTDIDEIRKDIIQEHQNPLLEQS